MDPHEGREVSEPESSPRSISKAGKNVKQKTGLNKSILSKSVLNKSILDQGWGEFRRQLEYEILWAGGMFIPVPPKGTSIRCPRTGCGHVSKENRKTQAQYPCVKCGFSENADLVGAVNILRAGHAQSACQVNGEVSSQQQEPPSIAA